MTARRQRGRGGLSVPGQAVLLLMRFSMAAGFCNLRNNNNYCTHHKLSSKSANASAAGYFDTLDKKLFRENLVHQNILILCPWHHAFWPLPSQLVFIPINVTGPDLKVPLSVTCEDTSVGVFHESGKSKKRRHLTMVIRTEADL